MTIELCYRSASDSLRLFESRQASPVELMRALLERAERLSASVNATTAIHADAALAAGITPLATGSDMAGSIRIPAALALELHRELERKLWGRGIAALICPTVFTTDIAADMDLTRERQVHIGGTAVDSYLGWVGTPPFNLLSRYPALAAPTGLGANGVPTSLQIVGPPFADEVVFRIAQQLASVLDSGLRQPAGL
ncbi:MAG TPA: hypothetical protein VMU86_09925 [Steroidobacteraceae bacterium]|nr:hypothetical protein [Steroidobacteraceae bacterium]